MILTLILLIFIFLFGLCVGSFLNVLIYRLPHSLPLTGRSFCPKCQKKISWQDNLPLLSFILLRGRCRWCHSPIGWRYPAVELLTGVLFLTTVLFLPDINIKYFLSLGYYLFLISGLIVIFFIDLEHQIIPDQVIYPAVIASFIFQITNYPASPAGGQLLITNYFSSAFAASGFFLLLHLMTRGRGMGLGDVKLAFLMGLILGFPKIAVAFYLAFLTGACVGVILILKGRKRFGQPIPFGPFLAGATIMALFWGEQILRWTTARFF